MLLATLVWVYKETCLAGLGRSIQVQSPRQMNNPRAALPPRMNVNNGKATALSMAARRMAVIGAARSIASGGRQSCFGADVICLLNSPSQGAIRNQPTKSGMKVVSMRGRKDSSVSPWVAKPITVMRARVRISPITRVICLVMLRF